MPNHGVDAPARPRVLEAARGSISASFCARLLGDLGMEVIKLEEPGRPDPLRLLPPLSGGRVPGLPFRFLNHAKREINCDLGDPAGRIEALQLLDSADVLVRGAPVADDLPFASSDVRARSRLVVVNITPLGADVEGEPCDDFLAYHRSGLGYVTPRMMPGFPTAGMRPLKSYSRLLEMIAGFQAAIAVLAALLERRSSGSGSEVDIAAVQCALPLLRREVAGYLYSGTIATRGERLWRVAPAGIHRCSDGYAFIDVIEDEQWRRLCRLIGQEQLLADPRFASAQSRFENSDALRAILDPWFQARSRAEVTEVGQANGVPIAPVNAPSDLEEDEQLGYRQFLAKYTDRYGQPFSGPRLPVDAGRVEQPARKPGQRAPSQANGGRHAPLAGYRVVELTHVWAGPLCGQILADLGAEVIKVESGRRLDVHRLGGPYPKGEAGLNRSGVWNSQNRGKLSCTIDLSTGPGRQLAKNLIAASDAVIENFSPGTLARLGLSFDELREVNPDIILVSLSAYGQTGPKREFVGYGPMMDAASGIMALTGYGDGLPRAVNGWAADVGGALVGALEVLASLNGLNRLGRWADVSEYESAIMFQFESLLAWLNNGEDRRPAGNVAPSGGFTECFACREEDSWIAVSVNGPAQAMKLAELVGTKVAPELRAGDADRLRPLMEAIGSWSATLPRAQALGALRQLGIPAGPVSDVRDLLEDPVLAGRAAFIETIHGEVGPICSYGPVWRFSGIPAAGRRPAPRLGEHNDYVLRDLLGLGEAEIGALSQQAVIQ